jgi:hypothetical protein
MVNQNHPITPPPELVEQWAKEKTLLGAYPPLHVYMTTRAAQWGADQELESCIELLKTDGYKALARDLRAARRPKPPSLKEQALALLDMAEDPSWDIFDFSIVRQALEALPND